MLLPELGIEGRSTGRHEQEVVAAPLLPGGYGDPSGSHSQDDISDLLQQLLYEMHIWDSNIRFESLLQAIGRSKSITVYTSLCMNPN